MSPRTAPTPACLATLLAENRLMDRLAAGAVGAASEELGALEAREQTEAAAPARVAQIRRRLLVPGGMDLVARAVRVQMAVVVVEVTPMTRWEAAACIRIMVSITVAIPLETAWVARLDVVQATSVAAMEVASAAASEAPEASAAPEALEVSVSGASVASAPNSGRWTDQLLGTEFTPEYCNVSGPTATATKQDRKSED
jgi:hypothetical protein